MWRALLRSLCVVSLAILCVAQESALSMALKDLMESKEFHKLKAKISENDKCASSYYMYHGCYSNRLVCCKTSGQWIIRRYASQAQTRSFDYDWQFAEGSFKEILSPSTLRMECLCLLILQACERITSWQGLHPQIWHLYRVLNLGQKDAKKS